MKNMKKLFSLVLALVMMMALVVTAGAESTAVQVVEAGGTDATITINNASKGVTYWVYKVFGATVSAANNNDGESESIAYTFDGDLTEAGLNELFEKVGNTNYVQMKKDAERAAVLKAVEDYALGTTPVNGEDGTVSTNGGKLQFKVGYGYYVIKSNLSTDVKLTVDSTHPNAEVNDKSSAETPHFDPNEGKKVNQETVKIGEQVTYTVKFITANWVGADKDSKQVKSYTFTDTLPTFLSDVNVTGITVKQTGKSDETLPVQQFDDNKSITIDWADETPADSGTFVSKYDNGAVIEITYTARVNGNATIGETTANKNEITATWNYTDGSNGGSDKTSEDVYTYSFEMVKYTKIGNTNTPLAGAKFSLYSEATGGDPIKLVKVSDNVYRLAVTEGDNADLTTVPGTNEDGEQVQVPNPDLVTVIETPAETGKLTIQGLAGYRFERVENQDGTVTTTRRDASTYWLEEVEAPNGYNKLTERKEVTISNANIESNDLANADSNSVVGVYVENNTGAELPSTGGIGTTIFYVVGGVLMVGAAILFLTKKRSEA